MGADPLHYDIDFDIVIYFALCMYMHRRTLVILCLDKFTNTVNMYVHV